MAWTIEFDEEAERNLRKLGSVQAKRIVSFLTERVAGLEHPRQLGKALAGSKLGNYWSYRVGDYRIICDIIDKRMVVLTLKVGNRRDVYK